MQATLKLLRSFIGHNFGDYKNMDSIASNEIKVLSVTILETTKTSGLNFSRKVKFYRSQFWRLQKPLKMLKLLCCGFIGHNFGDYKNRVD